VHERQTPLRHRRNQADARAATASNDGSISVHRPGPAADDAEGVCKNLSAGHDVRHGLEREEIRATAILVKSADAPEVYRQRPDVNAVVQRIRRRRRACRRRHPADRAVLAEVLTTLRNIPLAECDAVNRELPGVESIKAHDGMLLANHGALTVGTDLYSAYYDGTIGTSRTSASWRGCSAARISSRAKSHAAPGLRHLRHQGAGADLRGSRRRPDVPDRQAPEGDGRRLIPT
jgi:hypothetical protein